LGASYILKGKQFGADLLSAQWEQQPVCLVLQKHNKEETNINHYREVFYNAYELASDEKLSVPCLLGCIVFN
jgi:HD superfamily phosphodiesterase